MKALYLLIFSSLFIGCSRCDKENNKWIIQNDSDYTLLVTTYHQGLVVLEEFIELGGTLKLPYGNNNADAMKTLKLQYYDSTIVSFDTLKTQNIKNLHVPYDYDYSDCKEASGKSCCTYTYTITNEHYDFEDSF